MNIIWSEKINLIQISLGLKNHPNTNTNIIRFEKITRIRIRILFGLKKITRIRIRIRILVLILNYLNNIQIPNYSLTSASHEVHSWGPSYECYSIWGKKLTEYKYEYYLVWKYWPNTNTNIIRFEKINRIRIRILFGLKILTEYEYEY